MQYLLMIYANEAEEQAMSPEAMGEMLAGYHTFSTELEAAGAMLGGNRLRPVGTATSVRKRSGDFTLTDGPFAETKEHLGGYYLIEAPSLDAAVEWAKKIPSVEMGTIEVRPIWDMENEGDEG
ncbi:MAG: YciI family protein [Planctomycetota bacterium]